MVNKHIIVEISSLKQAPFRFSEDHNAPLPSSRKATPIHENLIRALETYGQEAPIHVRRIEPGKFQILDGHIVVDAARQLGWTELEAIEHAFNDEEALLFYTRHNLNRCGQYGHFHVKMHRVWAAIKGTNEDKVHAIQKNCSWPEERIAGYIELNDMETDANWVKFGFIPREDDDAEQSSFDMGMEQPTVPDNQ